MGVGMIASQYYLYVALPAPLSRRVAAIGRRYGSDARSGPHITLVIPRTLAAGRLETDLVTALTAATARVSPFRVRYRGVGYFGEKDFIYASVHRTPGLVACHQACLRAVRGLLEPSERRVSFARPHITLAGRLAPEAGARAWRVLRGRRFDGAFQCRQVLLWRRPDGRSRWELAARLTLGGPV